MNEECIFSINNVYTNKPRSKDLDDRYTIYKLPVTIVDKADDPFKGIGKPVAKGELIVGRCHIPGDIYITWDSLAEFFDVFKKVFVSLVKGINLPDDSTRNFFNIKENRGYNKAVKISYIPQIEKALMDNHLINRVGILDSVIKYLSSSFVGERLGDIPKSVVYIEEPIVEEKPVEEPAIEEPIIEEPIITNTFPVEEPAEVQEPLVDLINNVLSSDSPPIANVIRPTSTPEMVESILKDNEYPTVSTLNHAGGLLVSILRSIENNFSVHTNRILTLEEKFSTLNDRLLVLENSPQKEYQNYDDRLSSITDTITNLTKDIADLKASTSEIKAVYDTYKGRVDSSPPQLRYDIDVQAVSQFDGNIPRLPSTLTYASVDSRVDSRHKYCIPAHIVARDIGIFPVTSNKPHFSLIRYITNLLGITHCANSAAVFTVDGTVEMVHNPSNDPGDLPPSYQHFTHRGIKEVLEQFRDMLLAKDIWDLHSKEKLCKLTFVTSRVRKKYSYFGYDEYIGENDCHIDLLKSIRISRFLLKNNLIHESDLNNEAVKSIEELNSSKQDESAPFYMKMF